MNNKERGREDDRQITKNNIRKEGKTMNNVRKEKEKMIDL